MAAVEHLGDVIDPLGPRTGVARGRPEVDVPEPGGDVVHGHAGHEEMGGPVGLERVRMREPLGNTGGEAVAMHEPCTATAERGTGA